MQQGWIGPPDIHIEFALYLLPQTARFTP